MKIKIQTYHDDTQWELCDSDNVQTSFTWNNTGESYIWHVEPNNVYIIQFPLYKIQKLAKLIQDSGCLWVRGQWQRIMRYFLGSGNVPFFCLHLYSSYTTHLFFKYQTLYIWIVHFSIWRLYFNANFLSKNIKALSVDLLL